MSLYASSSSLFRLCGGEGAISFQLDTTKAKKTSAWAIHIVLRDRICYREYLPGTLLRENELAAEFSVSRTPVREALQRLQHLGMIESRIGVGTMVTKLSANELGELYEMRLKACELIGVMNPCEITPKNVKIMTGLIDRAVANAVSFNVRTYFEINHQAHFELNKIIGNQALRHIIDQLYFRIASAWFGIAEMSPDDVAADLVRELTELSWAMMENDPVAVGYIQRNHIAAGLRRVRLQYRVDKIPAGASEVESHARYLRR